MEESCAVTVKLNDVPAMAVLGAFTAKCEGGAGATLMALEVPVIELVTVSVAVIVWLPVVFNVAKNEPVPPLSVLFVGSTAWESELVKCTVPL